MMQANCKNQQRPKAAAKAFRIELEPVNEFITTEGLAQKLKLMAGGVGLRLNSLQELPEHEDQATSMQARLIDWIRNQGGSSSVRDVYRAFGFRSVSDAESVLSELVRDGRARWLNMSRTADGAKFSVVELIESDSTSVLSSGRESSAVNQAASDQTQETQQA